MSIKTVEETKVEVVARAIAKVRYVGALQWEKLTEWDRNLIREEAEEVLAALTEHADDHVWTQVTPPGKKGALPFMRCGRCGETGWLS